MTTQKKVDRETADVQARATTLLADTAREKRFAAQIKTAPTDGTGRFSAIVSTFGPPPDHQGDVVSPGAFLHSIAEWRRRGKRPSIWWEHDYKNPAAALGTIERMFETDAGLVIEGKLDLSHEPAVAVYEGLLAGRLNEFSIGLAVLEQHRQMMSDGFLEYNVLDELEPLEVSVVHAGANRFTRLLDVKSANTSTTTSTVPVTWSTVTTTAPTTQADRLIAEARKRVGDDAEKQRRLDLLTKCNWTEDNLWLLQEHIADVAPAVDPTIKSLNDRLDAIEYGQRPGDADAMVDAFVLQVREEMVEEALDRAEQAAWEGRMDINAVLGPLPVRVDARMRPDR